MAVVTKTEFAKMCGVDTVYINQYVLRKKLVQIEKKVAGKKRTKKLFDTENPYNRDFFNKRMEEMKGGKKELKPLQNIPQKATPKKKPDNEGVNDSGYDLDQKKKQRDIELKELSIEQKKIELDKIRGKLIPKDLVQKMMVQLSQSFLQTYTEKSELFVVDIGHKNKLSRDARAELKGQMIDMINKAHKKSIEEAKSEFKTIVGITKSEFSEDE